MNRNIFTWFLDILFEMPVLGILLLCIPPTVGALVGYYLIGKNRKAAIIGAFIGLVLISPFCLLIVAVFMV